MIMETVINIAIPKTLMVLMGGIAVIIAPTRIALISAIVFTTLNPKFTFKRPTADKHSDGNNRDNAWTPQNPIKPN